MGQVWSWKICRLSNSLLRGYIDGRIRYPIRATKSGTTRIDSVSGLGVETCKTMWTGPYPWTVT